MEYSWFVDLISTVGLPVALVIAMGWFIFRIYKKSEQREDDLRTEIKENQKVNAQAIATITLYAERLGTIESDVKEIKHDVMLLADRTE